MALYVYWLLLALVLVGLEMATGTFYLLIVAIAMTIGGASDLLGLAFAAQLVLAALAGITGIILLLRWKKANTSDTKSMSLDIGKLVKIIAWHEDGTARVFYRGTEWDAEFETKESKRDEVFFIKDIKGSVLILTNRKNDISH